MTHLGFVGLGMMGSRIARRLLDSGHQVSGYNRTRARAEALIQAGMAWKETPKQNHKALSIGLFILKKVVSKHKSFC